MKCYACGSDRVTNTMGKCPDCGCTLLHNMGMSQEDFEAKQKTIGKNYRDKKLGGMKIGLVTYSHEMKNGKLVQSGTGFLEITDQVEILDVGEAIWNDQKFARIDGGEELNITVVVDGPEGRHEEKIEMTAPATKSFWQAGIVMEPGFQARLLVGDATKSAKSDKFRLV